MTAADGETINVDTKTGSKFTISGAIKGANDITKVRWCFGSVERMQTS